MHSYVILDFFKPELLLLVGLIKCNTVTVGQTVLHLYHFVDVEMRDWGSLINIPGKDYPGVHPYHLPGAVALKYLPYFNYGFA